MQDQSPNEGARDREILALCDLIRETAFALHCYLRHGYNEKIYERGLANRLRKQGVNIEQQSPLAVYDEDGTPLGDYYADLLIPGKLILELKACSSVTQDHYGQIMGYMRAARIRHGLLINFGAPKLFIKKFIINIKDDFDVHD